MPCAFSQRSVAMLSLSSIQSVSQAPVVRPSLVADAVRPSSPLKAIEPTTAVSKERSRAENKTPEAGTSAQVAAAARAAVPAQAAAVQQAKPSAEGKAQQAQAPCAVERATPCRKVTGSKSAGHANQRACFQMFGKRAPEQSIFCWGATRLSRPSWPARQPKSFKKTSGPF
jgi:hypothetical protein